MPQLTKTNLTGTSIHSKISHLLSLSLYRQALVLLFDLYVNKTPTKLGSLQRWVRDCDATSRPGKVLSEEEVEDRLVVLQCLDMVLRVCGGEQARLDHKVLVPWINESQDDTRAIQSMKVWNARKNSGIQEPLPMWDLIQNGFDSRSFIMILLFDAKEKTDAMTSIVRPHDWDASLILPYPSHSRPRTPPTQPLSFDCTSIDPALTYPIPSDVTSSAFHLPSLHSQMSNDLQRPASPNM